MSFENLGVVNSYQSRNPYNYQKFEQISRDLTSSWLTLTEIQNQLNLFGDSSQDTYLLGLELSVRMIIEDYLGLSIFPITYRVYYNSNNLISSSISFDLPEVSETISILSLKFYSNDAVPILTTLEPINYFFDATGNKVICNSLPSNVNTLMTSPIVIEYSINEGLIAQYPVIKQAGLLLFTHLYNNRSDTTGFNLSKIPFGVDMLLRPYKPLVM